MQSPAMLTVLAAAVGLGGLTAGESWPQWRGVNRDGRTAEVSGWNGKDWQIRKVWEKNVWGRGNSAPIIVAGRVYLTGHAKGRDHVCCLEAATGKLLWRRSYKAREFSRKIKTRNRKYIGGPISTPTFDVETKYLYTYNPDGILKCWNTAGDGAEVWTKDILKIYDPPVKGEEFGQISCPLIDGRLLVLEVGAAEKGCLVAFDKTTGKEVWQSAAGRPHGRSGSPVKLTVDGVTCYAAFAAGAVVVVRGDNRKTVGEVPWQAQYGHHCATPVVVSGDKLLCTSVGRTKTTLLQVSLNGSKPIWTARARAKTVSPVLSGDGKRAFFSDGGRIRGVDMADGRTILAVKGKIGGDSEANMVGTGDGKLVVWGGNKLVLIDVATGGVLAVQQRILTNPDKAYPQVAVGEGYIIAKARNGWTACYAIGR